MRRLFAGIAVLASASAALAEIRSAGPAIAAGSLDLHTMTPIASPNAYRLLDRSQGGAAAFGDTYGLELLGQNSTNAFFATSVGGSAPPADTNYDGLADSMGLHSFYAAPSFGVESNEQDFVDAYGRTHVVVQIASVNGADLLPAGVNGGAGGLITTLRMDMGRSAAGTNQLAPLPLFDVILARVVLFIDGSAVLSGNLGGAGSSAAGQLAQTGLKNVITVTNAAGAGIDAIQFQYIVGTIPEPTTISMLLVGGLALLHRRR